MSSTRILDPILRSELDTVRRDLHRRYGHQLSAETIDLTFDAEVSDQVEHAKITRFIPILVEREVAQKLEDLLEKEGLPAAERQEILYVCQFNAGRSQLAASITHHLAGEDVVVRSVGTHATGEDSNIADEDDPAAEHIHGVYPTVIEALREKGFPTDVLYQKQLVPRTVHRADVVVLLGVEEIPDVPGVRYEHWDIADPKDAPLEQVRTIRDELEMKIRALLAEMGIAAAV